MSKTANTFVAVALALACAGAAHAQNYPSRSVRFVIPGPPGGATDILARTLGEKLNEAWGQPVVPDNRAGAGGIIGSAMVAKAPPDGYTILMGHSGTHAISVGLQKNLPYHPLKDFAPVTLVATGPNVLVVHPSLPVKTVKQLIGMAKARPGAFSFASGGVGLSQHLSGELFATMAGIKWVHVPYKGSAPGLTDVIAGNVLAMFPNIPSATPHLASGRLRALGVTSLKRSAALPNVPTITEAALPGFEAIGWYGVFVPAAVPGEIVKRLHADIVKVLAQGDVRERISRLGADPAATTPEQFARYVDSEIVKWSKVIRDSGATAD